MQLVDELPELAGRLGRLLGGDEAVQHQDGRLAGLHLAAEQVEQAAQPILLQVAERAEIEDRVGDRSLVEEAQVADMQQHPRMSLRQQRDVEGSSARRGMVEAELVAEDRLARSGIALDDVDATLEEAAIEDRVEPGDAGRQQVWRGELRFGRLGHRSSLSVRRGSTTVKVDPSPGRLATRTSPPIASTRRPTIHRPTPKPPCWLCSTARSKRM